MIKVNQGGEDAMPRQFKTARKLKKLKLIDAAELLGVSQPTLSAWESGRKSPSMESLENMANLYGVTTDFLLGREDYSPDSLCPIPIKNLSIQNGKPVWSRSYGWMLVDAADQVLLLSDSRILPFEDAGELYIYPPPFSESMAPTNMPLPKSQILQKQEVWLEPISPDLELQNELRGWYRVKSRWVENEYGNRFYLDTYGAKWLAFEIEL